ncbi:hypothetical protein [Halobacillus salinus]|uniref:hypothetical protein n=1 Tax=Halobacillus salinus TaxID=192814 RepID=UPI0009A5647D|nr:hypothetical protein [Halobacillus salinus]
MKPLVKKLYIVISSILIVVLSFFSYQYYQEAKEEKRQWGTFVNHFYFSIDRSIRRIDYLVEQNPEGDDLQEGLRLLERELLKSHDLAENASNFLDSEFYGTFFFESVANYLYGMRVSESKDESQPIMEDGKLDKSEVEDLKGIQSYLIKTKEEMFSEETGQENPDLTVEDMNEIVTSHLGQDMHEIYSGDFLDGEG